MISIVTSDHPEKSGMASSQKIYLQINKFMLYMHKCSKILKPKLITFT